MSDFKRQLLHDQIAVVLRRDLGKLAIGHRLESDEVLAKRYAVSLSTGRTA